MHVNAARQLPYLAYQSRFGWVEIMEVGLAFVTLPPLGQRNSTEFSPNKFLNLLSSFLITMTMQNEYYKNINLLMVLINLLISL